jgi:hypothetical protein
VGTWHNASDTLVRFVIDRDQYEVPPFAECTLPRVHDYIPIARGLPLKIGPSPKSNAVRVEPTEAPRPTPERLPAGVEAGKRRATRERDQDPEEVMVDDDLEPTSDAVTEAATKLEAQGVKLPGKRAK